MAQYEYRVMPAPTRGLKATGARSAEGRFAAAIEVSLNSEAAEGWEFLRAETLPNVERQGLTGTRTSYQTVLVFRRRADTADEEDEAPRLLVDHGAEEAAADAPEPSPAPAPDVVDRPA